jgi:hypothetical protein
MSEDLKNAIILLYANKQDEENAKSVADLIQIYGLDRITSHTWYMQPCNATTGEGLFKGLKWISDKLVYKNTRFPKNPYVIEEYIKDEEESMRMNNNSTILNNTLGTDFTKNFEDLDNSEINDDLNMSK